jgi:hypothetical protein
MRGTADVLGVTPVISWENSLTYTMSMSSSIRSRLRDALVVGFVACDLAACGGGGDKGPTTPIAVLTTINVGLSSQSVSAGNTTTATASGTDQNGAPIGTGTISW